MACYVIAYIKNKETFKALRIINEATMGTVECAIEDIKDLIDDGITIENILYTKAGIIWDPEDMEKYPILDEVSLEIIKNKESITVLGQYANAYGKLMYKVANYKGKTPDMDKAGLIRHEKKYILTNYNILSTLGDEDGIIEIDIKPQFSYNAKTTKLSIVMTTYPITELNIPDIIIDGKAKYIGKITIDPIERGELITRLTLPKSMTNLNSGMFKDMPNLKILEVKGKIKDCEEKALCDNKELVEVIIKGIECNVRALFMGLLNLKKVTFGEYPAVYGRKMFKDCVNLDTSNLFGEGLINIGHQAFENCLQITELILPRSINKIKTTAFRNCKNIDSVRFKGSHVQVQKTRDDDDDRRAIQGEFLGDSKNATIYSSNSFYIDKTLVNKKVNYIKRDATKAELKVSVRISKARLLGHNINEGLVKSHSEMQGAILLIDDSVWKEAIVSILKTNIRIGRSEEYYLVGNTAILKLHVNTWHSSHTNEIDSIKIGDKVIAVMFKDKAVEIILICREIIAEGLKNEGGQKYYTESYAEGLMCKLRKKMVEATEDCGVVQVLEEDKHLVLTYSNGRKDKITYTSI